MSGSGQHRRPRVSSVKKAAVLGALSAAGVALSTGAASAAEQPQQASAGAQATTPDAAPAPSAAPAGGLMGTMTQAMTPGMAPGAPGGSTTPPASPDQASATTEGKKGGGGLFVFNVPVDANILNNVAQGIEVAKNISGTNVSVPTLMGKSAEQSNADGGNTVDESHHNLESGQETGPPSPDDEGSGESDKPDDGSDDKPDKPDDESGDPPWGDDGQNSSFLADEPVLDKTSVTKSIPSLGNLPLSLG